MQYARQLVRDLRLANINSSAMRGIPTSRQYQFLHVHTVRRRHAAGGFWIVSDLSAGSGSALHVRTLHVEVARRMVGARWRGTAAERSIGEI
jgi:hypothetical protein